MTPLASGPPSPGTGTLGYCESTVESPEWSESPRGCRVLPSKPKVWPWTGTDGGKTPPSACAKQSPRAGEQVRSSHETQMSPQAYQLSLPPCHYLVSSHSHKPLQLPNLKPMWFDKMEEPIFHCSDTRGNVVRHSLEQLFHLHMVWEGKVIIF